MQEILYLEIPTPEIANVRTFLQNKFQSEKGKKISTPDGFRLLFEITTDGKIATTELSVFVWELQRTTYLKAFLIGNSLPEIKTILDTMTAQLRQEFPYKYDQLPEIDLAKQTIFEALAPHYPLTAKYFAKMPQGAYDLTRAYWWEKRWREGVLQPEKPKEVIFLTATETSDNPSYDLIYVGGALGVIHAAVMARLGYKVLLLERLPFSRMNREWNISRDELQSLINLGLFTGEEVNSFIAREYRDGFSKFFDSNNPAMARSQVLHTPKVLNVALNSEKLLSMCGEKLLAAGGEIWDKTEFINGKISKNCVTVSAIDLTTNKEKIATGKLLVDAMGSASPIPRQLNGIRAFDSICPTVGAIVEGFDPEVWDANYGDVLYSHGDTSRGRQLIWELFPGEGKELTIYLFHYHQVHPENPGSLLEMYEDFFTILPEYRRCDLDKLTWKKPTFGYIPGHFSQNSQDRKIAFDRLISIGDAASLQSPLVFTGFGSLVRNLKRLTELLNIALKYDLLSANHLEKIRAYQSNISVTWLFSKGMMVPTGKYLPPARINSILNVFFGILAEEPPQVAETFIKDKSDWFTFTRLALQAAIKYPTFLIWILDFITLGEVLRWLGTYFSFTLLTFIGWLFAWIPALSYRLQPWLEPKFPAIWLGLLALSYNLTDGIGKKRANSLANS